MNNCFAYEYMHYMFLIFHRSRMFLTWCHKTFIRPLELILIQPYNKSEPNEDKWVEIYTLTKDLSTTGECEEYYRSYNIYFYPYMANFVTFVENQYHAFSENPIQLRDNTDFFKKKEIQENLFIVRTEKQYVVMSFPVSDDGIIPTDWKEWPKPSEISFSFIEYYHPRMDKPLEIVLSSDFYTIGNELFTKAFVLRQLELMNCYFVFDDAYEIHFIDHDVREIHLKHNEHIEIRENSYINIRKDEGTRDNDEYLDLEDY